MDLFLTALSGLAWTIVYAESIRVGLRERTYSMPIAALGLNIAWEWLYAVHGLQVHPSQLQTWVNLVWGLVDIGLLVTYFRAAGREFPGLPRWAAWGNGVLMVAVGLAVQLLFVRQFGISDQAPVYSAFLQNVLMSGLFLAMFVARGGSRGQNLTIAVAKWLGTLAPTILYARLGAGFAGGLGVLCSVLDLTYIALLLWARRQPSTTSVDARTPRSTVSRSTVSRSTVSRSTVSRSTVSLG